MKTTTIKYLSYGKYKTGGFRHEDFLTNSLSNYISKSETIEAKKIRPTKFFKNFLAHIELLWFGFKQSNADYTIVVGRLALSAILRNLFSANKIIVVLHNYDDEDRKKFALKLYFEILFGLLRTFHFKNLTLICVAKYWQHYFTNKLGTKNRIEVFPNFFDVEYYKKFKSINKEKRIHLGQWNSKNHPDVFIVAKKLCAEGYECYFSTNDKDAICEEIYFTIRYENFEEYLSQMASCQYTLALSGINEGWNRIAHESILVGTTVIGYSNAGLGELLEESNSLIANSSIKVLELIEAQKHPEIPNQFFENYDVKMAEIYMENIF